MEQQILTSKVEVDGSILSLDLISKTGQLVAGLVGESRKNGTEYFIDTSLNKGIEDSGNMTEIFVQLIIAFIEHFQEEKSFTIHIKMNNTLSDGKYQEIVQYLDKNNFIDKYRILHDRINSARYLILECN